MRCKCVGGTGSAAERKIADLRRSGGGRHLSPALAVPGLAQDRYLYGHKGSPPCAMSSPTPSLWALAVPAALTQISSQRLSAAHFECRRATWAKAQPVRFRLLVSHCGRDWFAHARRCAPKTRLAGGSRKKGPEIALRASIVSDCRLPYWAAGAAERTSTGRPRASSCGLTTEASPTTTQTKREGSRAALAAASSSAAVKVLVRAATVSG